MSSSSSSAEAPGFDDPSVSALALALAHLGGSEFPSPSPEELKTACEMSGGRDLVAWLLAQLSDPADPHMSSAALSEVSLEREEAQLIQRASQIANYSQPLNVSVSLSGYARLSQLRSWTEAMSAEADILERDTVILKQRLKQTKLAGQKATQALKSLREAIKSIDYEVQQSRDVLSELSLSVDASVEATVAASTRVLCSVGSSPKNVDTNEQLTTIHTTYSDVLSSYQDASMEVSNRKARLPNLAHVSREAARLQGILSQPLPSTSRGYQENLAALCSAIQTFSEEDELARFLEGEASQRLLDLIALLQSAWNEDQASIMDVQTIAATQAIDALNVRVLVPLQELHRSLSETDEQTNEAEALIGAFIEELQDITEDVNATRDSIPKESPDKAFEGSAITLLKSLKGLRPKEAPPLYLLEQEDILAELSRIVATNETLLKKQAAWVKSLPESLSSIKSCHDPVLGAVYQNSPMNTFPPFTPAPEVATVERFAWLASESLITLSERLEKDIEVTPRTREELDVFVSKWDLSNL